MFIAWLHFAAMYYITGVLFRLASLKFPNSPITQALMFAQ